MMIPLHTPMIKVSCLQQAYKTCEIMDEAFILSHPASLAWTLGATWFNAMIKKLKQNDLLTNCWPVFNASHHIGKCLVAIEIKIPYIHLDAPSNVFQRCQNMGSKSNIQFIEDLHCYPQKSLSF